MSTPPKRPTLELEAVAGGKAESVRLLDGGAEAFPRMLEAIGAAKSTVHLQIYIFSNDSVGRRFVTALGEAARRGVKVNVYIDGWGSLLSGRSIAAVLRESGCEVVIYHRFLALILGRLRRNHRKILLVDDHIAFVGGINIGEEYETRAGQTGWADLAVEVVGEASAGLGQSLRGEKSARSWHPPVQIYLSGFGGGYKLRSRYLRAFASAKTKLTLAHAYFLPDARLARALRYTARRGVEVRLLLAGRSDVPFARSATLRLYRGFLKAGVRIFEWHRSVLHAKAALIDEQRFLVGSFNLDPLSLANLEALVEVDEAGTSKAAAAWLEGKIAASSEVTLADCRRDFFQRWIGDVLGLLMARAMESLARLIAVRRPRPFGEANESVAVPRLGARSVKRGAKPT